MAGICIDRMKCLRTIHPVKFELGTRFVASEINVLWGSFTFQIMLFYGQRKLDFFVRLSL